jgi:hypothetical protein
MPKYNLAHANDEEEQDDFELVGSKDLRESFNERNGRLRGSFSVNGYELHNFEANTPANLVALLNAKSNYTHVQAQIDDGGHLVLTGNGPTPIRIAQGAAFVEPPPVSGSGDAADQVLQKLKTAADKDASKGEDGQPKNTILEDLGLEATPPPMARRWPMAANVPGRAPATRPSPTARLRLLVRRHAMSSRADSTILPPTSRTAPTRNLRRLPA